MDKQMKVGLALVATVFVTAILFWNQIPYAGYALLALTLIMFFNLKKNYGHKIKDLFSTTRKKLLEKEEGRVGIYLNVFQWNIFVRTSVGIVGGFLVTFALLLLDALIGSEVMNFWITMAAFFIGFLFFVQSEPDDEVVPEAHGAMITFWSHRFRVYRREGTYSWTGKFIGIKHSTTIHTEGTDKNGFIKLKPFPISIWNQLDQKGRVQLEINTRDSSTITATLTLIGQLNDPYLWLDSADPVTDLAEQTRTAFRTAAGFFTGVDCALIKNVLITLMGGNHVQTVFLPKNIDGYPKGSVIRNHAGSPMLGTDQEESKDHFADQALKEGDEDMLKACLSDKAGGEGKLFVERLSVEDAFTDVMERLGYRLIKAAVGNIDLSVEVTIEANKAASEVFQRAGQIASAKATAEGIEIFGKAAEGQSELVTAIVASKDYKNVKVVVTGSGNNKLKDAAATHASLRGDNNE